MLTYEYSWSAGKCVTYKIWSGDGIKLFMGLIDALFTAQRITQRKFKRSQMLPKTLQKKCQFHKKNRKF